MTQEQIKKIIEQLRDHEKRLAVLENITVPTIDVKKTAGKQQTLRELIKGRSFKNGQEQVAVIVGYYEKILGSFINKDNLKAAWENAKIANKYNTEFINRAKDLLIRIKADNKCDLTQAGEEFFDKFLKNESVKKTS